MDMTTQQAIDKLRRIREEAELMLTGERVGEFSISINSFNELSHIIKHLETIKPKGN